MLSPSIITLASDFGSPYPAAMRGVILDRAPGLPRIIDITHQFPRQDVRTAAFWLRELLPWFPPAVHCAVVDPGVGTDRAAVALQVGEHILIGPDNGLLAPVARELEGDIQAFEIVVPESASNTFHGRDVFAPAAAVATTEKALARKEMFVPRDEYVDLQFPRPTTGDHMITGTVLVTDDFGNLITNIPREKLPDRETLSVNGEQVPFAKQFAAVPPGDRVLTIGSHGNLELDVNQGRGEDAFGLTTGETVHIDW